jgi:DNA-binding CsgD family transcriptional regulator
VSAPLPVGAISTNPLLVAGFEALDLLKVGVVVCNASAKVLTANRTAERILGDADGLELDSDGGLTTTLDQSSALRNAIAQVAANDARENGPRDRAFAVRRPSGSRPLTLFLRAATAIGEARGSADATVLIMIQDSTMPVETAEAELRQLYGLTSAEARLSNLLMEGVALDDCCTQLGIRRTTARMHLRNIFAKTGVRRQGELVALLLRSIGLGPRLR